MLTLVIRDMDVEGMDENEILMPDFLNFSTI